LEFVETTRKLAEIDLGALDTFAAADLLGCFARLRAEAPVSWHRHPDSGARGFWAVVRYRDIATVLTDPATYSSRDGVQLLFEGDMDRASRNSMLEMDPPRHTRYRKVVSAQFSPRGLRKTEPAIRRRIDALLDGLEDRDEIDFVRDFATPLPMGVFFDMMGVPEADHARMLDLADRTFFSADPRFGGDPEGVAAAGREFQDYGRWLGARRRAAPKDDLMSALAFAEVDGAQLSADELGAFFGLLGSAGADTTRSSLANGLDALRQFPDQKRIWLEDVEGLAPGATEEILRWASAVFHMRRTAVRDVELGGRRIREGDKVAVWFVSGNRDEAVFDDPHRFDVRRRPNPHMSFGLQGPHFCLGAHLARLQIRLAYTALLRRFPDVEAAAKLERLRGNFINGPGPLPARLRARAPSAPARPKRDIAEAGP